MHSSITFPQLESGIEKILYRNSQVSFTSSGKSHKLVVKNVQKNSTTFVIYSNETIVTLFIKEEKKLDLDNNSYYDLYLKLNSIKNYQVNLTMKSINESIHPKKSAEDKQIITEDKTQDKKFVLEPNTIMIIAVTILIILIIVILNVKKKKRLEKSISRFISQIEHPLRKR